ncbi:ABC transporter ATP-binding protein [Aurantimonas sp. MSK8Z-1]|uniref:ABC transporter ATP-binding protein n=1 Tax=Mangrovibrevibacter kandeliae TaxID=2968473 RepID=UPI002118E9BA|nr:ABC transporter ATP-binding protein [Aurantimonas sp. MSK8Z-1]MCW4115725.1 ABC transporter ATP-binding protein [Aurantimonas sp. MSK8Z-1]
MPERAADVRFEATEKSFGPVHALHPLSLTIEPGTLFALLGPSGCGKTTTLRLVAGFEQPSAGQVFIAGKDVTGLPAYKRNFGMVFQSFALFPHLTVGENVAFGLQMRRVSRSETATRVQRALDLVALGRYADRYPSELSGGQQQRVALARAVVFEPDVLLLDEPLSALDKMLREQMQVEIRQLQQRLGMTTVFVTHDQEEALTMADRIAVMRDGRLLQSGAPRDIYERPDSQFVATFLGASNILTATVEGIEDGTVAAALAGQTVRAAAPPRQPERGAEIALALRPERIAIGETGLVDARVEDFIYRGATVQVSLDLAGQPLNATLPSDRALGLKPGAQVRLSWPDDALVALSG